MYSSSNWLPRAYGLDLQNGQVHVSRFCESNIPSWMFFSLMLICIFFPASHTKPFKLALSSIKLFFHGTLTTGT